MEQILFAIEEDIPIILSLMNGAVRDDIQKDWYVTDDEDFVRRHIGGQEMQEVSGGNKKSVDAEGYTLKYVIDGEMAAFLLVRHPGEAEDNLGRNLFKGSEVLRLRDSVAEDAEAKVAQVVRETGEAADFFCISHMESAAVHPDYRGRGLQGKLLQEAERIERQRGTRFLMATVHPDNVYSLRNLEAAGFQCIQETRKYGGLRRKVLCKRLDTVKQRCI